VPSEAIPPGAHRPPPAALFAHALTAVGSAIDTATIHPRYGWQAP
jgi:hypothetical protein